MSSPLKNVIIAGASGHLGSYLLSAFESDPRFNVSVLTRHSSKAVFPAHIKVRKVADDYPETELVAAFLGQDVVVSSVETRGTANQKSMIDAAVKAGVKRFVPSQFGTDLSNEKARVLLPNLYDPKFATLEYVKEKEKEGLSWTTFVTGPFFELAIKTGFLGFEVKERKVLVMDEGDAPWSTTTMPTIALAVKNAMLHPQETKNKTLYIDSVTASSNQVVASLEKATGEKFEITHTNADEAKKICEERLAQGDYEGASIQQIRQILLIEGYGSDYTRYRETSNKLLSLPEQTLDELIMEMLKP